MIAWCSGCFLNSCVNSFLVTLPLRTERAWKGHCWCPIRCSLLGLFIHPLAAVLAHCFLLCSGQWPESHCSMELCLLSPQPLADWQEVQRTFSLPQFMFQSVPHVQTEASHLLRSNLWLAPSPILIWFPHSPSPESFPFINHLNIDFCLHSWFLSSNGAHFSAGFYFLGPESVSKGRAARKALSSGLWWCACCEVHQCEVSKSPLSGLAGAAAETMGREGREHLKWMYKKSDTTRIPWTTQFSSWSLFFPCHNTGPLVLVTTLCPYFLPGGKYKLQYFGVVASYILWGKKERKTNYSPKFCSWSWCLV